jgi:hypothetical protein
MFRRELIELLRNELASAHARIQELEGEAADDEWSDRDPDRVGF